MLTDEKFYDKLSKSYLLTNTEGKNFTFEEYSEKIKVSQTDKNDSVVYLYTNNVDEHDSLIETAKAKDEEETFIKLEGVNSKEAAARFTAKPVWLLDADFRKLAGKDAPISLLGYEVITDEDENLGPIEEVIEQPHQVLLRVTLEGNEALIPLHAETLDKIDRVAQKVYVTLPDGLLDIYRGL